MAFSLSHFHSLSPPPENPFPATLSAGNDCPTSLSFTPLPSKKNSNKTKVLSKSSDLITKSTSEHEHLLKEQQSPSRKKAEEERNLADIWREIHGTDDWVGLLDPFDPFLRAELIRYGELAQACYDAFDYDPYSKYCGSCKYPRDKFFESLGLHSHHAGYTITRYLYATSNINLPNFFRLSRWSKVWSNKANWIGYVAVSDDATSERLGRRDIVVAWRGTVTRLEWIVDLMDFLKPINGEKIPCPDPRVKVESGFVDLYTDKDPTCLYCRFSAREQLLAEVKRLMKVYADEEISITMTGHSLGSALAIVSAYDIAETGLHIRPDGRTAHISVISFSSPRVGNVRFKERLERVGVKVLRAVNVHDMVPKTPGFLLNEGVWEGLMKLAEGFPWSYSHVGVELALDHTHSPFLKDTNDPVCSHNLEALLHLIDGYHGKGRRFHLAIGRDIALVNKACDFLKDHHQIPPHWRQDENRGMVRSKDGRWIQADRPAILDDHPDYTHHHLLQLGLLAPPHPI